MKILVVDDNENIAKMLQGFLEIKNYDCTISLNGRNALDLMTQQKFDLIILDLSMPKFSGFDVIDDLEKKGKIKEQNIIVLTAAYISADVVSSLLEKGVKFCLKKPLTPEILLDAVSSIH